MPFQFGGYSVDVDRRELRRGAELIDIGPQVFDLLVYLIRNRDRVVSKDDLLDAVWEGRIVSESTLTSRINAVRHAIGDTDANQTLIKTIARKGFLFIGEVEEVKKALPQASAGGGEAAAGGLRQEIHFCTASDGVRIAYAAVGKGPPLVKAANWLNHLEYDWQSPIWSHLLRAIAARYRLIRYDERGNGLSDWDVGDISFEAFVRDLESVVDANGLKRFPLLGISQGCAVSIPCAIRSASASSSYMAGMHAAGVGADSRARSSRRMRLLTLMRQGWGQENPAFRQIFTSLGHCCRDSPSRKRYPRLLADPTRGRHRPSVRPWRFFAKSIKNGRGCIHILEFPDGRIVLLTMLGEGQEATVLQLPAQPTTPAEEEAQQRVAWVG